MALEALIRELQERVAGEVRFDAMTKVLYSTDASIYEIEPLGVVIPREKDDVIATIQIAGRHGVPVLPRGAGTSLAGQACGRAIHLDMSKYLNGILEVNPEERWARIEPGVVLDELNAHLRPFGLMFPPDVATSNRANIGGMIGNNSAGAHSILYGKTIDHVLELTAILSNGEETRGRALTEAELAAKVRGSGLEAQVIHVLRDLAERHRDEIAARYPKIMRRVGGYNLDEFVKGHPFNLAKILVGSEGTLAATVEAKVNLVPRPKMTALAVVHFRTLLGAMEATTEILPCGPSAVELVDKTILDLTKGSLEYSRRMTFVEGDPAALLLVEFYGASPEELRGKIEALEARLRRTGLGTTIVRAMEAETQQNIWRVRKAGLGLLLGMKGDQKPIAFVEDTAVPPERLAEYVRRFDAIVRAHDTAAAYYAHASVGCLHIRPIIDLKQAPEVEKMRSIAEQVSDLVLEFGGAMSAEHGDGLARSCWNEKMFGPTLYKAFQEVKAAFDPHGIMNPGKIVNAPPMTENLRYGPRYRARQVKTYFSFAREGGFDRAVELCNGAGVCKKKLEGTMCPSYMVTREEEHSTRGRANALRAAINGHLPAEALTSHRMYEVLDLCLECKGCKAECPSNVDMAKLKYEFLAHYYAAHGTPLRARLFGHIAALSRLGCAAAPLSNWVLGSAPVRFALEKLVGVDRRRRLPPFARPTFEQWFAARNGAAPKGERDLVVLFNDTFMTYNYPEIGRAAVALLEAAGFHVILAEKRCCGRPMISKGMVERAREHARYNLEQLSPYAEAGVPIVGCEPSCILTFRDEYPDLVEDARTERLARHVFMIEEFLLGLHERGALQLSFRPGERDILFHGHCHQKALIGSAPSLRVLRLLPGARVAEVDSGCCGMAGSFGYEREHYDISLAIGGRRLLPAVQAAGPETEIVAAGISCRQQIAHATGRRAKHLVEVLAAAL
ncbi:MAG: anaerobic glycerol-3-phosphate dehydrogenase subunit C [candidate division NC10 bacterium]|nr:anaerobic glycerol-3-phosphate dehydrogenase subunit C [candidate division NC10 bacterium]